MCDVDCMFLQQLGSLLFYGFWVPSARDLWAGLSGLLGEAGRDVQ